MIGNFTRLTYKFGHTYKNLFATAKSTATGLQVTFPHQKNATMDIESPLEAFVSTLAAC